MRRRTVALVTIALASIVGASCGASGEAGPTRERPVREGNSAPAFTLPSAQGGEVSLQDYMGQRPVLLYFSMGPG
jgi:cytochrome oxidase Cu insertion factor (SCO1/SenC/PrrC family)